MPLTENAQSHDPRPPTRPSTARRGGIVLSAVLLIHLGLLGVLRHSGPWPQRPDKDAAPRQRVVVRIIPPAPVVVPAAAQPKEPPAITTGSSLRRARTRPNTVLNALPIPPRNPVADIDASPGRSVVRNLSAPMQAEAADPPASAPPTSASIMDSEATRRALRESARAPSLGDRLAHARDEPARASPAQRLAEGVRAAGKGDCAKGEYPGAGMGLLSVPFLAAAVVGGNCAK